MIKPEITLADIDNDGILTITFNRVDKLNALNSMILNELETLFLEAKNNGAVRAILITGQGKAFCAGADIKQFLELDSASGKQMAEFGQHVFRLLETCGKPSIAAINGFTFGGGCELAMAASGRIAVDTALFGQPEVKLGLIPGFGGTQRLARLVGKGRAIDLCITGRSIDAKTALDWGLINAIAPANELLSHAREWLLSILDKGPQAIRLTLETIDHGYDLTLDDAFAFEAAQFGIAAGSDEMKEGVNAFLEKRPANFNSK